MRKCSLMFVIPTIVLLSCGRTGEQSRDNKDILIDSERVLKAEVIARTETKDIASICSFIDSLYNRRRQSTIDTLAHLQDLNVTDTTSEFMSVLGQKIKGHFRWNSFDFFQFDNSAIASAQFSELIKLADVGLFAENPGRMYDIFPKGGSTIILFNETIIRHVRACDFDEAIEGQRESLLVNFLFGGATPDGDYFLRIKCAGAVEIK